MKNRNKNKTTIFDLFAFFQWGKIKLKHEQRKCKEMELNNFS